MRASSSERTIACPASIHLPTVHRSSESREDAAAYGTLVHWWKETGEEDPAWASPSHVKTFQRKLAITGVDRDEWWSGGEHEVTFAINLRTHELRLYDMSVYLTPLNEMPGFADVVVTPTMTASDIWKASFAKLEWLTGTIDYLDWGDRKTTAWVDDLKTGRWPVAADGNAQLKSYSLVPWIAAGKPMAWEGLASITQWEKYPLKNAPRRTHARPALSALDLMEHLEALLHSAEHPDEVNPTDDGCRFCDCRPLCPAFIDGDQESYGRE